jgi:hypothetical protein
MCLKLLKSADQSLPHKHNVDKKQSLLLLVELGFDNKYLMRRDAVQYIGRSGRILLHHSIEDETQFALDIRLM